MQRLEGDGIVGVGQSFADEDVLEARDGDDVARSRALGGYAFEGLGDEELGDLRVLDGAIDTAPRHALTPFEGSVDDAAQGESAQVGRRVEVAHERLETVAFFVLGCGYVLLDRLEQGREIARRVLGTLGRPALTGARVEDGKGDLVLVRVKVQEQVLDLLDDLFDPGVGSIDLVDHEHDRQASFERLAKYETGLG